MVGEILGQRGDMTTSVRQTRSAILDILKEAFENAGIEDIDVFDWHTEEYAKGIAVILGSARSEISRDRFATPVTIPFGENWDIDIEVKTTGGYTDNSEISDIIYDVSDLVIEVFGSNTNLSGMVDGLVRCFVQNVNVAMNEDSMRPEGLITLNCEYRIDRRRLP